MNCPACLQPLAQHPNYPRLFAPCPCKSTKFDLPVGTETLERIRAGIDKFSEKQVEEPLDEDLKPPMEWLKELPDFALERARQRFREHPLGKAPTERRNALREAFWWGHVGTGEYYFWKTQNRIWRDASPD